MENIEVAIAKCVDYSEENVKNITPAKYFLARGTNIPEAIAKMELQKPFGKKVLTKLKKTFIKIHFVYLENCFFVFIRVHKIKYYN